MPAVAGKGRLLAPPRMVLHRYLRAVHAGVYRTRLRRYRGVGVLLGHGASDARALAPGPLAAGAAGARAPGRYRPQAVDRGTDGNRGGRFAHPAGPRAPISQRPYFRGRARAGGAW